MKSPRIKLSNSNTNILDGIATGVLLKDFVQHLKRKNAAIPDIHFTLLDPNSINPDLVINSPAKAKNEEIGSLSKSEWQKLHSFYTQGLAAYGSVRDFAKAAKLSPSKVRKLLQSKSSYTRFTQATSKFK